MSTTARSERPIRRWISTVRPSGRPRVTSRGLRLPVEAGSMPYSAVSQPPPDASRHAGHAATSDAVQITRVPPIEISADPSALRTKPGSISTGRSSSRARPSWRGVGGRRCRSRRAMLPGPAPALGSVQYLTLLTASAIFFRISEPSSWPSVNFAVFIAAITPTITMRHERHQRDVLHRPLTTLTGDTAPAPGGEAGREHLDVDECCEHLDLTSLSVG